MCVAEYVISRLHPGTTGYKCLADHVLLRAYTCVAKTGQFRVAIVRPTTQIQSCTPESRVTRVSRTKCCCEHAYVCCRISEHRVACKDQSLQRLGPPMLLRAHTCVLQVKSMQGCTRGSRVTRVWLTRSCCENTHVYCRIHQFGVAPECQGLQWFGRSAALASR